MSPSLQIFHCPANVGGQPWGLREAEVRLGHESSVVVYEPTVFRYQNNRVIFAESDGLIRRELKRWALLGEFCAVRPDLVHFNFGQKILSHPTRWAKTGDGPAAAVGRFLYALYARTFVSWDVRILRKLGSKVAVTFQGDDIRQGDFCRQNYDVHFAHEVDANYYDSDSDDRKRAVIRFWDRFANCLYALNPDLLRVLPARAKFLPYAHVRATDWEVALPRLNRVPVLAHAPTHRTVKGTNYLLQALDALRSRGYVFELRLIEGLPHEQALREYLAADIVIDQLLAGWFGGLAVEVMAMGKPVIAYLREKDFPWVPQDYLADLPVINASPANIESVLAYCLDRPERWAEWGRRGREFVERHHDPDLIARRIFKDIGL